MAPLTAQQVADAGDIACNPFDISEAVDQIEAAADALLGDADHLLAIGGDHTIAYPLLRVTRRRFGPVALVHFDAHLDTWQTYFGAPIPLGTPFRRAARRACSPATPACTSASAAPSTPAVTWTKTPSSASASCPPWIWNATGSTA